MLKKAPTIAMLTPRQLDVLKVIDRLSLTKGVAPTIREIGEALGGLDPTTIFGHLRELRMKDMITHAPFVDRGIALTEAGRKHLPKRCPHCDNEIYG